jgi:hypothetical protein
MRSMITVDELVHAFQNLLAKGYTQISSYVLLCHHLELNWPKVLSKQFFSI